VAKRVILVIDDEPLILRLVKVNLERAGYAVETAADGIEALRELQAGSSRPDLILLDAILPYKDGFEVLSDLKADLSLDSIPVIMMTARSRDADIIEGHARGAARYLLKPVEPNELLAAVREQLGEAEAPIQREEGRGKREE
jgi:two-component system alkaline phosphatase synthesis response regulator PhoP